MSVSEVSVALRRSSRKRKCPEFSSSPMSVSSDGKIVMKIHSSEDESSILNDTRVRLPTSASTISQRSRAVAAENKSPAIQNPISFYGKSSQNLSFSEGETTHDASVALQNVVKHVRREHRENRVLINSKSALVQKQKRRNALKHAKSGNKSQLKKNLQKFPTSTFMKKSILEMLQPKMPIKDDSDTKEIPPKRKFFNTSSKEKIQQMTTTLFGKQRICAATILNKPASNNNNCLPLGTMNIFSKPSSSLTLSKKRLVRTSKSTQESPQKEMAVGKMHFQTDQGDFLDSIDQMHLKKTGTASENLQSLDSSFSSLLSSEKENCSTYSVMKSKGFELHVPNLQNLHIDSPSPRAFIQHYHYSPSSNENTCMMDDMSVSNINSPCNKSSPRTPSPLNKYGCAGSFKYTASIIVGSPPLSSTPETRLYGSPLPPTAKSRAAEKQSKSAWPIHYSREKENLSNLQSKRRSSKSLLPIFKNSHLKDVDGKEQLIIDAGQNKIGAQVCSECGMLYNLDSAEDVGLHVKFHNTMITNLRFQGWKKERVVREFKDGRVLLVLPEDPKYALKKVNDVKSIMDANLGFHEKAQPDRRTMQVYFFVMQNKIVGCLIAEAIKQAFRVIATEGNSLLTCSTSPETALCGVNRIWTLAAKRRCQVASHLIDCMRTRFYFGCEVTIDQIAFSDPTPDGRKFAANYTSSDNFLVYK